jgi:diacylglycerol kinase (ATP)
MTAPYFFLINPAAGSGAARRLWPELRHALDDLHIQYEYEATQGPLTGTSFVRQALRAGARTVVAVGGDGTINEVVNGFFLNDDPIAPDASLGVIPAGSSSDIARALGIPAGATAAHLLTDGQTLNVDLGKACFSGSAKLPNRYFLNNADVGIGGRIAANGTRFKRAGGRAAFALSSVGAVLDPRPWSGTLALDDGAPRSVEAVTVVIALGPYTGGGMHIAPGAKMDDGLFDVVTIAAMPPHELLVNLPRIYAGTHLSHPAVTRAQARTVRVEPAGEPIIELDGEIAGAGSVEFRILAGGMRIHVGKP